MTSELSAFLRVYLPDENLDPILQSFHLKKIKKGRHLLKPGMDCNFIAFVQKGCFRAYYLDEKAKEVITWFSFQDMVITDMLGYYTSGKAQFYVESLDDCVLYIIEKQTLEKLYQEYPAYINFGRKFAEEALAMLMQRTLSLHTKSAEARYKELLLIPDFMNKIPLKYLASFLGITDTSLSRIRKKIR